MVPAQYRIVLSSGIELNRRSGGDATVQWSRKKEKVSQPRAVQFWSKGFTHDGKQYFYWRYEVLTS